MISSKIKNIILVVFLGLLALAIRSYAIFSSNLPLNDGGMFYVMVEDLVVNNFSIPRFTNYNFFNIPYTYSPLAFYLTAFIWKITNIELLSLFRFLPLLFSLFSIPVFFEITKKITKSTKISLWTLLFYVTSPRSFQTIISGGGLTRSLGFFFALLTINYSIDLYQKKDKKSILLTSIFAGLCILTHIENAAFAFSSVGAVFFASKIKLKDILNSLVVVFFSVLFISPFILQVFDLHGALTPFAHAFHGNLSISDKTYLWNTFSGSQLSYLFYMSENQFSLVPLLAIIGLFYAIVTKEKFLIMWTLFLIAFGSRMAHLAMALPLSIFSSIALVKVLLPSLFSLDLKNIYFNKHKKQFISCFIIILSLFSASSSFGHKNTPINAISNTQENTMNWIKLNTPKGSKFIVITPMPSWIWFADRLPEWFPALAKRQSIATPQGKEWLTDFRGALRLNEEMKKCNNSDVNCLENTANRFGMNFDHIYIPSDLKLEPDFDECCTLLKDSIMKSQNYQLIYSSDGELVFAKI